MSRMASPAKLRLSEQRFGELDCTVLAHTPSIRPPRFCVILCHGFGAPGTDLVALGPDLAAMCPEQAEEVLFVFPQGPLDLETMGLSGARAWWMIDIERFQRAAENPEKMARFRQAVPTGMPESSQLLRGALAEIKRETGIPTGRTLLGGFSQGSMVATDLALRLSEPPAALCVFSGTLVAEEEWHSLAQKRGKVPVLQSHGYFDSILPFKGAEALRNLLTGAGLEVEFLPFDGPHTIPYEALERLAHLMRRVFADRPTT
jgi:phospholipase/carboxylesterase